MPRRGRKTHIPPLQITITSPDHANRQADRHHCHRPQSSPPHALYHAQYRASMQDQWSLWGKRTNSLHANGHLRDPRVQKQHPQELGRQKTRLSRTKTSSRSLEAPY
ncbi:unnamed protein product [Zymoseptoria tritici ST99CH_3D7]|uniref:Uncharacterized protein n=1 Tax=Zymoseptoria tritici (strain ST99CH_3D7) TaxID=1276538 RepID=A0A1X7S9N1_ZYMT9|nr:unnamed protein product [Zymoseptoria tritici ST99CH_3D7]